MGAVQTTMSTCLDTCRSVPDRHMLLEGLEGMDEDELDGSLNGLILQLFRLQDLNGNGYLEEDELVQLNKKIAMLHSGKFIDKAAIKEKFVSMFRDRLDPEGNPVPASTFRNYIVELLHTIDKNPEAQQMILEQWVAEAELARGSFREPSMESISDLPFLLLMPKDRRQTTFGAHFREVPPPPASNSSTPLKEKRAKALQKQAKLDADNTSNGENEGATFDEGALSRETTVDSHDMYHGRGSSCASCEESPAPSTSMSMSPGPATGRSDEKDSCRVRLYVNSMTVCGSDDESAHHKGAIVGSSALDSMNSMTTAVGNSDYEELEDEMPSPPTNTIPKGREEEDDAMQGFLCKSDNESEKKIDGFHVEGRWSREAFFPSEGSSSSMPESDFAFASLMDDAPLGDEVQGPLEEMPLSSPPPPPTETMTKEDVAEGDAHLFKATRDVSADAGACDPCSALLGR